MSELLDGIVAALVDARVKIEWVERELGENLLDVERHRPARSKLLASLIDLDDAEQNVKDLAEQGRYDARRDLELQRQLDATCPECRAAIDAAMREEA